MSLILDSSFSPTKRHRPETKVKMTPRITMSRLPSESFIGPNYNEKDNPGQSSDDGNEDPEHLGKTSENNSYGNLELEVVSFFVFYNLVA